jgi:hypothetical protein
MQCGLHYWVVTLVGLSVIHLLEGQGDPVWGWQLLEVIAWVSWGLATPAPLASSAGPGGLVKEGRKSPQAEVKVSADVGVVQDVLAGHPLAAPGSDI